MHVRLETTSDDRFLSTFNAQGEGVWSAWDEYLEKQCNGLKLHLYHYINSFAVVVGSSNTQLDAVQEQAASTRSSDKSVPITLLVNEDGWPLLPEIGDQSLTDAKAIIRSYLTLCYRLFSTFILYISWHLP
jgi:hypothetical protein